MWIITACDEGKFVNSPVIGVHGFISKFESNGSCVSYLPKLSATGSAKIFLENFILVQRQNTTSLMAQFLKKIQP